MKDYKNVENEERSHIQMKNIWLIKREWTMKLFTTVVK